MTKLSVNINKIATLRNARGGKIPDVVQAAINCERFGADGITVHPRPDERHIRYKDVLDLKEVVTTEFNIEGYPTPDFIKLVLQVQPAQVTLVPDPPDVLTSNAGWIISRERAFLTDVIAGFKKAGIRVSVFMDPDPSEIELVPHTGADRIELYTETYAAQFPANPATAIAPFIAAAKCATANSLGINAGHDLNLDNLGYFHQHIEGLLEVSIGHALICDAIYYGLENVVQMYMRKLKA